MSVKKILVGLGLENCTDSATRHAITLAKRFDASLTGVALVDMPGLAHVGLTPIGAGAYAYELSSERTTRAIHLADEAIARFQKACTAAGVPFHLRSEEGDPLERLIAVARYHDLAIVGREGLCEQGVIDEPLDALVRLVGAGVRPMVVTPAEHSEIRRVMVAFSGSMESAKTLRRFVQLRLWPEASMRLVHFSDGRDQSVGESLIADAAEYCAAHGLSVETDLRDQSPRDGLLPAAEEADIDLLVMGNSARRLLIRRLFGETMLQVVRKAKLPLFLGQ